jgi:hypothetical protein
MVKVQMVRLVNLQVAHLLLEAEVLEVATDVKDLYVELMAVATAAVDLAV